MSASFAQVPARAVDDPNLTVLDLKVLLVIGCHLDTDHVAWPSQRLIADRLGVTREAVNRSIRRLEDANYLLIIHEGRENRAGATLKYKVRMDPTKKELADQGLVLAKPRRTRASGKRRKVVIDRSQPRITTENAPSCDPNRPQVVIRGDHTEQPIEQPISTVSYETAQVLLFPEREVLPQSPSSKPKPPKRKPPAAKNDPQVETPTAGELQKSIIFGAGLQLLRSQGVSENQARSFLGKLIQRSSTKIVADCVRAAADELPIDARGWLTKAVAQRARRAGLAPTPEPPTQTEAAAEALADLDRRMGLIARGGSWKLDWGDDPRSASKFYDGPLQGQPYPRELYTKHGIPHPADRRRERA